MDKAESDGADSFPSQEGDHAPLQPGSRSALIWKWGRAEPPQLPCGFSSPKRSSLPQHLSRIQLSEGPTKLTASQQIPGLMIRQAKSFCRMAGGHLWVSLGWGGGRGLGAGPGKRVGPQELTGCSHPSSRAESGRRPLGSPLPPSCHLTDPIPSQLSHNLGC